MKKKKYYDGPGGVFYNPTDDSIFIVTPSTCGGRMWNMLTEEDLGGIYKLETRDKIWKRCALTKVEESIRLGDL